MAEFTPEQDSELRDTVTMSVIADLIYVLFKKKVVDEVANARRATLIVDDIYRVYRENPTGAFRVLVNMVAMGPGHVPSEARAAYMQALTHPQTQYVAVVGEAGTQMKVLSFMLPFFIGLQKKVSWFETEEEARAWLSEQR